MSLQVLLTFYKLSLHSFDNRPDVSACGQIFRTIRIRDSKDSRSRIYSCVATGVNEHPCAVTPLGHVHVPSLPVVRRVLRISNLSCIYICSQANIIPGGCLTLQRLFCYKKALPSSRHRILRLF